MALQIDNLDALMPSGTVRYTLTGIKVGSPLPVVLTLRHAGQGNDAWLNARRKVDVARGAQSGSAGDNAALVAALVPAVAKTVIVGWENVLDEGKPAPYTPAQGEWLLSSILGKGGLDIVNSVLVYAFDPTNFRDVPPGGAEQLGNG